MLQNSRNKWFLALLTCGVCASCVPSAGQAPYGGQEEFPPQGDGANDTDTVADPYDREEGEVRLSISSLFYEGETEYLIDTDEVTSHFWRYQYLGRFTFGFGLDSSSSRLEGSYAGKIVNGGVSWWGGAVHWDIARDISLFKTLRVSFRSEEAPFEEVKISMQGLSDATEPTVLTAMVEATTRGYSNDGEWHSLEIPLSKFTGMNFRKITEPLKLVNERQGTPGDVMWMDNLYFTTAEGNTCDPQPDTDLADSGA